MSGIMRNHNLNSNPPRQPDVNNPPTPLSLKPAAQLTGIIKIVPRNDHIYIERWSREYAREIRSAAWERNAGRRMGIVGVYT